jgi:branched-chain amino acid transport system permease protein
LLAAALVAVIAAIPLFVTSGALLNALILTLYAALLGQAWNVLAGFGGQFSFGHAAFFGTGAYATAILQVRFGVDAWVAMACAIAIGALVGALVGALAFRYGLKGSYFALVTLAFAEVLRILATTFDITGAGVGMMLPLASSASKLQFATPAGYLWFVLALVAIGLGVHVWLRHSRFGAWLTAIRDNEASAAALGVNVLRVKLGAITLSAAMMAAGGVFYVQYLHYIDPGIAYGPAVSVEALLGPIVGGLGTVFGPLLGALALHTLSESMRNLLGDVPGTSLVLYGAVLILMVRYMPRGLIGVFERRR